MRFTSIIVALASVGAALAAASPADAAANDKLAPRADDFRHALRARQWGSDGSTWGQPTWAPSGETCDADNDCPRICRNSFGDQFNDEGTKCCNNYCSCAGGCQGIPTKNNCDHDNDCPRVCEQQNSWRPDSDSTKCCSGTCNCNSGSCGWSGWNGWNGWRS